MITFMDEKTHYEQSDAQLSKTHFQSLFSLDLFSIFHTGTFDFGVDSSVSSCTVRYNVHVCVSVCLSVWHHSIRLPSPCVFGVCLLHFSLDFNLNFDTFSDILANL